jgi:peptide/nickel transport system substrate-binding protein
MHERMGRGTATLAAVLLAISCTPGSEGDAARSEVSDLRGGTLRIAVPDALVGDISLDPQLAYAQFAGMELLRCCLVRTLFSYNGKSTDGGGAELRPDLAADPDVSHDGLTWTFRLRPGLHYAPPFEDTPIVALDVVRALEREARVRGSYASYFGVIRSFHDYRAGATDSIVGLETPADRTLVVRLDGPATDLAYRFSLLGTAPIPEGVSDGHDEDYERFLVASGPYMVEGSGHLDLSVPPDQQEPVAGYVLPERAADGTVEEPGSLILVRNPSWDPATDRLRPAIRIGSN